MFLKAPSEGSQRRNQPAQVCSVLLPGSPEEDSRGLFGGALGLSSPFQSQKRNLTLQLLGLSLDSWDGCGHVLCLSGLGLTHRVGAVNLGPGFPGGSSPG